jgi:hypothetical protein
MFKYLEFSSLLSFYKHTLCMFFFYFYSTLCTNIPFRWINILFPFGFLCTWLLLLPAILILWICCVCAPPQFLNWIIGENNNNNNNNKQARNTTRYTLYNPCVFCIQRNVHSSRSSCWVKKKMYKRLKTLMNELIKKNTNWMWCDGVFIRRSLSWCFSFLGFNSENEQRHIFVHVLVIFWSCSLGFVLQITLFFSTVYIWPPSA